jgi:hypothetical protein
MLRYLHKLACAFFLEFVLTMSCLGFIPTPRSMCLNSQGLELGYRHDSVGQLHHEAERHLRDDPDHLADR